VPKPEISKSKKMTLPETGKGRDYRQEASGPDLDSLLRDLFQLWISESRQEVRDMAISLRIPKRRLENFLKGNGETIEFLSRICALMDMSIHDMLSQHENYKDSNNNPYTATKTISMKTVIASKISRTCTIEELRGILDMVTVWYQDPRFRELTSVGMVAAIEYAQEEGFDVSRMTYAVEQVGDRIEKARKRGKKF